MSYFSGLKLRNRTEIESQFNVASESAYKEITYTNGQPTAINIYSDNTQNILLFTKVIGYTSGNVSSVVVTDNVTGGVLTKTISYINGEIASVDSVYTPASVI